jgi:hypothetical protein
MRWVLSSGSGFLFGEPLRRPSSNHTPEPAIEADLPKGKKDEKCLRFMKILTPDAGVVK